MSFVCFVESVSSLVLQSFDLQRLSVLCRFGSVCQLLITTAGVLESFQLNQLYNANRRDRCVWQWTGHYLTHKR